MVFFHDSSWSFYKNFKGPIWFLQTFNLIVPEKDLPDLPVDEFSLDFQPEDDNFLKIERYSRDCWVSVPSWYSFCYLL